MCVVSNIGDMGRGMWPKPWKGYPYPGSDPAPMPGIDFPPLQPKRYDGPTREQFEEFLKLLRAGARFDAATGQPGCELEEKIGWLRELAKHLGFDPKKVDEALRG